MAQNNAAPLARLIEQFERLPGIGRKNAQRLAYHILSMTDEQAKEFADTIVEAKTKIHRCPICCDLTDAELCPICKSPSRDKSVICVVEDPKAVMAIERTHEFGGVYHVLHGLISPMNGVGPDDLCIKELVNRLGDGEVKELIMATNPTAEGDVTATESPSARILNMPIISLSQRLSRAEKSSDKKKSFPHSFSFTHTGFPHFPHRCF